jgi:hypothetical protein
MKIPAGESRTLTADLNLSEVLEVEGVLVLDPNSNVTIATTKNIVVTGDLISQPNPDVVHIIRFTGIDESKFVGGGDTVLDSDTGMWVMGAGQLNLLGILSNFGDYDPEHSKFAEDIEVAIQTAIPPNMRIEGTTTGQAHVFIKSTRPQSIKYVQLRYLGPRRDQNSDGVKELVTGRYACHFHHSDNGSRGSIIEGCIARDCNNHCFVPHGSHGITMRNNIVYNVMEAPFWYDFGHRTHDLLWENNLVVNVKYAPRSLDQDSDGAPTFGAGGFVLGSGNGNKCNGNVVIGTSGEQRGAGAYIWPELRDDADNTKQLEDSWEFEDNTAINCPIGISVWQNNLHHHIIRNTTIINCPIAIFHGAYQNHYRYIGGRIIAGTIDVRAASATTNRVRFEEMDIDAGGGNQCVLINEGPLDGVASLLFRACKFRNYKVAAIIDQNPGPGKKNVDVIDCGIAISQVMVSRAALSSETIRIQEGSAAWQVTKSGSKAIALFAPANWGIGTGLKAEYFTPDFKTLLLSRIEPNINLFDLTHPSPHYLVPTTFAARWTGKIQPQYTEAYTFYCNVGGGVRLWVDNKLIIDKWAERYPGEIKALFGSMIASKVYDLKLEFFNSDDRSGCTLEWASPSLKREFIPMSQLYPGDVKPPDPPTNQPPTANAGVDQVIEVSAMLYGTGVDPEGKPVTYKWEQTGGTPAVIESPATASTKVSGLKVGELIFKLTVTDDKGSSASDEVKISVK